MLEIAEFYYNLLLLLCFAGLGNNTLLIGNVSQVNMWFQELPSSALMAMSRGVNSILSYDSEGWNDFSASSHLEGNVINIGQVGYIRVPGM